MQNSYCQVVVYFGNLVDYFDLWLLGCASNPDIDFFVFTDANPEEYDIPLNVKIIHFTLGELAELIEKRLGFEPALKTSYKVCDYRPAYGVVFAEWTKPYSYWGHCDIDQLFGDLSMCLPSVDENPPYDRIFWRGHFSFYRNSPEINTMYTRVVTPLSYKEVFQDPVYCGFDEWQGISYILRAENRRVKTGVPIADLDPSARYLRIRVEQKNYRYQAFSWEDGHVYRYWWDRKRKEVQQEEMMIIHFMRHPKRRGNHDLSSRRFWITPETFIPMERKPTTKEEIDRWNSVSAWERIKSEVRVMRHRTKGKLYRYMYGRHPKIYYALRPMVRRLKSGLRGFR